jgi:hypothetical protein
MLHFYNPLAAGYTDSGLTAVVYIIDKPFATGQTRTNLFFWNQAAGMYAFSPL